MVKKRWKDMNAEERRLYNNQKNAKSLAKKRAANPARAIIQTERAAADRKSSMKHYHKKKEQDREATLAAGRAHQKALRIKRGGGVIAICVKNAIKNVLKPFKKESARKRLMAKQTIRNNARYANGGVFRTRTCMAARCLAWIKRNGAIKSQTTFKLVGATSEESHDHVVSQLLPGEQLKHLEIDHVFPFTAYDVHNEEDQRKVMNYTNFQPLPKADNGSKSDRLPTKEMAAKVARWAWPDGVTEDMLPDIYDGWATPLRMKA